MDFELIVLALYHFTTFYPCALLCFISIGDKLKRPIRKIIIETALMCFVIDIICAALYVYFEFDRSGNVLLFAFLPFLFLYYRKNTAEDLQKLLFVFCMVIHVASIIGGAVIAVRMIADSITADTAQTTFLIDVSVSLINIIYFIFAGRVIRKTVTPRLSRIEAKNIKRLWLVPLLLASIPIYYYSFYPISEGVNYIVPVIFLIITVLSLAIYGLILGMLDNMMKSARIEAERVAFERAAELKSEIMRSISHETRTPLAIIRGLATASASGVIHYYFDKSAMKALKRALAVADDNSTDL